MAEVLGPPGPPRAPRPRFHLKRQTRSRKVGWRKTTPADDAAILACFKSVRQPLGSLVEAHDVWQALPVPLRNKVTMRTVANRLRDKGFSMQDKLAAQFRRSMQPVVILLMHI